MYDTNEPRTVDESYQVASSTSDLSVDAERSQPVDVIIAAGLSDSRLGMALLRLVSEWDSAAKPLRLTDKAIDRLAAARKAEHETACANRQRENLERLESGQDPLPMLPPMKDPLGRARVEAALWYARELRLLAVSLRSRGIVLAQITAWALSKGIDPGHVGPAIFHWLSPKCSVCDGHGLRKAPDAPALSAKRCHACGGTGQMIRPEGASRIQSHMDYAVGVARHSLRARLRNR